MVLVKYPDQMKVDAAGETSEKAFGNMVEAAITAGIMPESSASQSKVIMQEWGLNHLRQSLTVPPHFRQFEWLHS